MSTLREFAKEWNKNHKYVSFTVIEDQDTLLPISVSVRFTALKIEHLLTIQAWEEINYSFERRTHGNAIIVSDQELLHRGIVEIVISSKRHNFKEEYIRNALAWFGCEFFNKIEAENQ